MATGDPKVVIGTIKTLEANGSSITNGAVVQADDASYDLATDAAGWPDAEFVLTGAFGTAPTEGRCVNLYARPMDMDGTVDAEAPEAARPTTYIGSFAANNVTATQSMPLVGLVARDLPRLANYYLHNDAGQTLSAGWVLKVVPRNVVPTP